MNKWLNDKIEPFIERIEAAKTRKVFPFFRPFENIGPRVKVGNESFLNFMSNDYLGLSQDRGQISAAKQAIEHWGTGLGSARPQATSSRHLKLERRLAQWLGKEDCVIFSSGYQALVGVIQAIADDETTIVLDKLSHASIIDGSLLAQGGHPDLELRFFRHNNVASLDKILGSAQNRNKLVVVEGLYSVDGDIAPLGDIVQCAKQYDAAILLDDAHGLGSIGKTGRGAAEIYEVSSEIDFVVGTFSKSFGGVGGFVCTRQKLADYLRLQARSFVFSASLPNSQVESAISALNVIENDTTRIGLLAKNAEHFREHLEKIGFDLGKSVAHITPIMIRNEDLTLEFAAILFRESRIMMMPFVSPGVAPGQERLRCNVTAVHSMDQMEYTLGCLHEIGARLGVVRSATRRA